MTIYSEQLNKQQIADFALMHERNSRSQLANQRFKRKP